MASKSVKSNKARIAKQRRETKAARAGTSWRIVGVAFCLGVIVTAGAFVLTPLGVWCVTDDNPSVASATKNGGKPQADADNEGARQPDPDELLRLAQAHAARDKMSRKTEKAKDPLAELRRIEEINARNRRIMTQRTTPGGHLHPHPSPSQPTGPTARQPQQPSIPGSVSPSHTGHTGS